VVLVMVYLVGQMIVQRTVVLCLVVEMMVGVVEMIEQKAVVVGFVVEMIEQENPRRTLKPQFRQCPFCFITA